MIGWLPVLAVLSQAPSTPQLAGRVVRMLGPDTVVVGDAAVVLHRVTDSLQGPIDSTRTSRDGTFRFQQPTDTSGVLLVSARWSDIEYFAPPIDGTLIVIMVSDTSSVIPITLAARHIIVGGPAADGTRDVVDLWVIRNPSSLTRVPVDSASPTAWFLVPRMAANLRLGDADFGLDAFDRHGDTLLLRASIPPGERQFFLQYQVGPGTSRFAVPLEPMPDTMTVLAEEDELRVSEGMSRLDVQELEGRRFVRWAGSPTTCPELELMLPGAGQAPGWVLVTLVAALAAAMVAALVRVLMPSRR